MTGFRSPLGRSLASEASTKAHPASERKTLDVARADLNRVTKTTEELKACRKKQRDAMIAAVRAGETYEDIGVAAGITRQRAHQIVNETDAPGT
jgi:predicted transcriptional regulator